MGSRRNRLKRRFAGRREQPPEAFVLFLDENLDRCAPILLTIEEAGVLCEEQSARFSPGASDDLWLPQVAANGWCILTKDKRLRYNEWEKRALLQHKAREFCFSSGNMSGPEMAAALRKALPRMRRFAERTPGPFVVMIYKSGDTKRIL
jgi:hypothetical protein